MPGVKAMHPQSDFDADLRRLRDLKRPDRVSGLLNSMHVTDRSSGRLLALRLIASALRTGAVLQSIAWRIARVAREFGTARPARGSW
jgi:hypothetical protein